MVEKNYTKEEPSLKAPYSEVRKFYASQEYYRRFFKRLSMGLKAHYGSERTTEIIKEMGNQYVFINGLEEFFAHSIAPLDAGFAATRNSTLGLRPDTFLRNYKKVLEGLISNDYTNIEVTSMFTECAKLIEGKSKEEIEEISDVMVSMLTTASDNPFVLRIIHSNIFSKLKLGAKRDGYTTLINSVIPKLYKNRENKLNHPKIIIQLPIYESDTELQLSNIATYLTGTDNASKVKKILRKAGTLGNYSKTEIKLVKEVCDIAGFKHFCANGIISRFRNILKYGGFKLYENDRVRTDTLRMSIPAVKNSMLNEMGTEYEYVYLGSIKGPHAYPVLDINYSLPHNSSFEAAEPHIDKLFELSIYREKYLSQFISLNNASHRINIVNVPEPTKEFVDKVKDKCRRLQSRYNKEVEIRVFFKESGVRSITGMPAPKYIRVISDIHIDVNEDKDYRFDFGNDYVLNCGDTAGNGKDALTWCKSTMPCGILIAGNHLGYSSSYPEYDTVENYEKYGSLKHTINSKNVQLRHMYGRGLGNRIDFLNNTYKKDHGIYFLGTTLYTDYCIFGEKQQAGCMMAAAQGLNDFKLCTLSSGSSVHTFGVDDSLKLFNVAKRFLEKTVSKITAEDPEACIVIMTHHAPTPYSVSDKYKNNPLTAAFASDLRDFISGNPNIRMWCHGHTHDKFDYIFKQCRVICDPFGYFNENNVDPSEYGTRVKIVDIKSKKSWNEILKDEIIRGEIKYYEQ